MDTLLSYEYEQDGYYCYPNSTVLRNKLNITDEAELSRAEREITSIKTLELLKQPFQGELDFVYLKTIHSTLFCDIYDWAGKIRTVDISKGNIFCQHELIELNAEVLMDELKHENYLAGLDIGQITGRLAYYLGDLNSIHPFREGNGRVQRLFIRELADRAGYNVDFTHISAREMVEASSSAFFHEYEMLATLISRSIRKK